MDSTKWCLCAVFILFGNGLISARRNECMPGLTSNNGYTVPHGDIVIENGTSLDIMCILSEETEKEFGLNASQYMFFGRNNRTMPSEMIEFVNSSTIRLHIENLPPVSSDTYSCLIKSDFVCMNVVSVGVKPQPITDFTCISYNYEKMTCTWTAPEHYIKTDYNITFKLYGRSSRNEYDCAEIKVDKITRRMNCTWDYYVQPYYRPVHEKYIMNLSYGNQLGNASIELLFNNHARLLSGPPTDLTVISTTPSSIYLSWKVPSAMIAFPKGLHHRVLYQSEYGSKEWHLGALIKNATVNNGKQTVDFNLTGLKYPNALYDIRVSIRSALATEEFFWSANDSITPRTNITIPARPPRTAIGSFQVDSAGKDYNTVFVYWENILMEERNGPSFKYDVKVVENPSLKPTELCDSFAKFENLSMSRSYTFKIWSTNAMGRSTTHSTVIVPSTVERVQNVENLYKVENKDHEYQVNWDKPDLVQNISSYTVFWCPNERERPHQCTGQLHWAVVSGNITAENWVIPDNKVIHFAVAANDQHRRSSGMLWATCTILPGSKMGRMRDVEIREVGSTYMEVGWNVNCQESLGRIKGFNISYCPIISPERMECKEPLQVRNFKTNKATGVGRVTNLSPYTTYMMSVTLITPSMSSQPSEQLLNTTLEAAPSTPPLNVMAVEVTNTSIKLTWEPPPTMNGVLKNYILHFNNFSLNIEKNSHEYTLTELDSFATYLISMQACTVRCSEKSEILNKTTMIGYPGRVSAPSFPNQNASHITINWNKPSQTRGRTEFYELKFTHVYQHKNKTEIVHNVTKLEFVAEKHCGGKSDSFFIAVRAANIDEDFIYKGPWSQEVQVLCTTSLSYMKYILPVVIILFLVGMGWLFTKLYKYCKLMRDVEVKLPPGLSPAIDSHWINEKPKRLDLKEEKSHAPSLSPDQVSLLEKKIEGNGDSGLESVTSSFSSQKHIANIAETLTDEKVQEEPYVRCKELIETEPVPEVAKSINPGYIPFATTEPAEKNSRFVVAGMKNCNGYIPFNQTDLINKNTGYVVAGIKNCKQD